MTLHPDPNCTVHQIFPFSHSKFKVIKLINVLLPFSEFSVQSAANEIKQNWKPAFLCNEEFAQLMLEVVPINL